MKANLPLLLVALVTFTGCSSPLLRPVTSVLSGAAGGVIGSVLSDGHPVGAAGGAAAGVALSEGAFYAGSKSRQRTFEAGYRQALGDQMKTQYWEQQFQHCPTPAPVLQVPVSLPERVTPDGVRLVPSTELIPIRR